MYFIHLKKVRKNSGNLKNNKNENSGSKSTDNWNNSRFRNENNANRKRESSNKKDSFLAVLFIFKSVVLECYNILSLVAFLASNNGEFYYCLCMCNYLPFFVCSSLQTGDRDHKIRINADLSSIYFLNRDWSNLRD